MIARWHSLGPRQRSLASWAAFVALGWIVLRPALLVTISLDDFVNPFYVLNHYRLPPWELVVEVSRVVNRTGHFNHLGQNLAAFVFIGWSFLMSWGVRYSLVYAVTKLVVILLAAVAGARLLRTLAALCGREVGVWPSRWLVAVCFLPTLQLHVPWSLDPVGSFPLFGYLPAAIALWALDTACRAMAGTTLRAAVAAIVICGSILYYEINVAVLAAFAPIVAISLLAARRERRSVAPVLRRAALVAGPAVVMTLVLRAVAAAGNEGYTGTDVVVGNGTIRVAARAVAGSLPATAWGVADDWMGGAPFRLSVWSVVAVLAVAVVVALLVRSARSRPAVPTPVDRLTVLLAAASPVLLWLAATAIQVSTQKVRAETLRTGYVYNYYAYGSIGVVLAVLVLVPLLRLPRGRGPRRAVTVVLGVLALGFVASQAVVNDSLRSEFDERLEVNADVLVAFSDRWPEARRCAALEAWDAMPFWQDYYRRDLIEGLNDNYMYFHGEPFCTASPTP